MKYVYYVLFSSLCMIGSVPHAVAQNQNIKSTLPLTIKEQGTFFVGGTTEQRQPNTSLVTDPRYGDGEIAVNQMYVEYQIPAELKFKYPIIMMHGGGHTGAVYRTKPDGAEGWFTTFARRGFAVYVVDAPNRGRSGWDPTNRFAVSRGQKPPTALESANIYSLQSAWKAFRWGPEYPKRFPDQRFPIEHLKDYLPQLVPSYRDAIQNDLIADDLQELIKRIGPCIVMGWSTGSGNVMAAASGQKEKVKGIVTLEVTPRDLKNPKISAENISKIPFLSIYGDNTSADDSGEASKVYTADLVKMGADATTLVLPEIGIKGNGHAMMFENNSEQIADLIVKWVSEHVKN